MIAIYLLKTFFPPEPGLTIRLAVLTAALPVGLSEVFEGQEEQNHLTFLVFDWNNIQEAPKCISLVLKEKKKKSKSAKVLSDGYNSPNAHHKQNICVRKSAACKD